MATRTGGQWTDEGLAADNQQPAQSGGLDTRQPEDDPPPRRTAKSRVDEWMEVDFKFGGSRIKRKAVALVLLGAPAVIPLFFMAPAFFTMNKATFAGSVEDRK